MTMAKLAPPKKASKPTAPKKPTSRSKTGNAACSSAASNWQLALRGKAALDPETYRTLAKCRAMNRTAKMAEAQGRTGKLSAMGESAVKARLQSRFDSGLITTKSRSERLDMLLKQRAERGKTEGPKTAFSYGVAKGETIPAVPAEYQAYRSSEYVGMPKQKPKASTAKPAFDPKAPYDPAKAIEKDKGGRYWALDSNGNRFPTPFKTKKSAMDRTQSHAALTTPTPKPTSAPVQPSSGEAIPPKAAPYSLGGKLAPGRGTEELSYTLNVGNSIDRSGKLVPGYAARITGTDPKYKLKREFLPLKDAKGGGLTVTNRGLYESRGPSTSIFGLDRANKPTEREYILIGRKKVRNLVDFQAERAVRLMERFRKS